MLSRTLAPSTVTKYFKYCLSERGVYAHFSRANKPAYQKSCREKEATYGEFLIIKIGPSLKLVHRCQLIDKRRRDRPLGLLDPPKRLT